MQTQQLLDLLLDLRTGVRNLKQLTAEEQLAVRKLGRHVTSAQLGEYAHARNRDPKGRLTGGSTRGKVR